MSYRKDCVTLIMVKGRKFNRTEGRALLLGVESRNARNCLGADFPIGYRLLVYSRCTQAFLF